MFEALLFIWLGASNAQTFSAVRYDSMEQCEVAREVTIKFVKKDSYRNTDWIVCEPVRKVTK